MKKVKGEDIAHKAGVSITAVSFALNNKPGVSEETARKIIQIARDMDYPIPLQSLEKTRIQVIKIIKHGNIINEDLNPFIMSYIDGMEQESTSQKSKIEIISYFKKPLELIIGDMKESTLDGFIVIATELDRHDILEFSQIQKPICFVDANYNFMPFSFVDIDNINSVGLVVQHLYEMGHRHIGLVSSSTFSPNLAEREEAFKLALQHFGLQFEHELCLSISPEFKLGYEDSIAQLKTMSYKPTALFCVNDSIAYIVIKAIQDLDINIPDDISIIGFDDLNLSKILTPQLSTVKISNRQIGMRAVQLLTQRIQLGPESMCEKINICGTFIARESVKRIQQ